MERRLRRGWMLGLAGLCVAINVQWAQGQRLNSAVSPIATPGVTTTPGVTATPTVMSPVATPTQEPTATEQWIQPIGTGTPYPTAIQLLRFTAR